LYPFQGKYRMINKNDFKEFGSNVQIFEPVTLIGQNNIVFRNNIIISEYSYLAAGRGLYVGNNIHIATQVVISGGGYCFLGDFAGVSAGVRIITGSEDISGDGLTNPTIPEKYREYFRGYVICEKHSFLATNVIVHPNVTIGEGAVVGSGSIVTKDLEPWGIYMGTPARKIRDRPKTSILEKEKEIRNEYNIKEEFIEDIFENIR
jgi:acetyltransferase-like isoleucine patch superfamily enzyme